MCIYVTTGTHSLPADADILAVVAPWGREVVVGTAREKKRRHTQCRSRTATGSCRSFSKKQFRESGSSSPALTPPPSWFARFGWEPNSDHNSCQRRFRFSRLRSSSSLALAYVARTRTFVLRSHLRPNHFCQAMFTIF